MTCLYTTDPSGSQSQDVDREITIYQIPEADPLHMVAVKGTEDAGCLL